MHQELKDSRIPMVTSNTKENVDTLYNGYNTARTPLAPLRLIKRLSARGNPKIFL